MPFTRNTKIKNKISISIRWDTLHPKSNNKQLENNTSYRDQRTNTGYTGYTVSQLTSTEAGNYLQIQI